MRQVVGKKGAFGIVKLDDGSSVIELLIYSTVWEKYKNKIENGSFLEAVGKVKFDDYTKQLSIVVDGVDNLAGYFSSHVSCIMLKPCCGTQYLEKIKNILSNNFSSVDAPKVCLLYRNEENKLTGTIELGCFSYNISALVKLKDFINIDVL